MPSKNSYQAKKLSKYNKIAMFSLLTSASLPLYAVDGVWIGNTTGWSTPENWLLGLIPGVIGDPSSSIAEFSTAGDPGNPGAPVSVLVDIDNSYTVDGIRISDASFTFTTSGSNHVMTLRGSMGIDSYEGYINIFNITNLNSFIFQDSSNAGLSIFNNNAGGTLTFQDTSTANNAQIVNDGTLNAAGLTATSMAIGSLAGSGTVILGDKTINVGTLNTSTTFGGVISGTNSSGLNKVGTGTLTLTGTNTYTGTTNISEGTLQIGNGGSTGSLNSNSIENHANLIFNHSDALVYSGNITGDGSVTKSGAGVLTLSGANTYTGATTINSGTIATGANSTGPLYLNAGTLQTTANMVTDRSITLTGGGELNVNAGTTLTLRGVISGSGGLTKSGTGTLVILGNNTYTGNTRLTYGNITIGDGTTNGSILGNIRLDRGIITFNPAGSISYSGNISGLAGLTKQGTGTLTLLGVNTFTGFININGGTVITGANGLGTNAINLRATWQTTETFTINRLLQLTNGACLSPNASTTLTVSSVIIGGALIKSGAGTLILTNDNTYFHTTITEGTLQIGNDTSSGSVRASITNNGNLIFKRSGASVLDYPISGGGTITQAGSGTLILTRNNVFSGITIINADKALQLGDNTAQGMIGGSIVNNGNLTFNRLLPVDYNAVISGEGSVTQAGVGTLTFVADQSYLGNTTINVGSTLQLGNNTPTGSLNGTLVNNGTLIINHSNLYDYDKLLSGSGNIIQAGSNTLILSNPNNNYSGTTTINSGIISIALKENLGTGPLILNGGTLHTTANIDSNRLITINAANGTFLTDVNTVLTENGKITGSGQLIKDGAGRMVLTNTSNDYSGGTLILGGTLQVTTTETNSSLPGDVTLGGGILNFHQDSNGNYTGMISGAGSVIKDGTGIVTLTAIENYTGQATINQGSLQVTTGAAGNNNIELNTNTSLIFNQNSDGNYTGNLTALAAGAGALVKLGIGNVILSGTNTYGMGTFIDGGTLTISNDTNLGAAAGALTLNGGTLALINNITMNRATSVGGSGGTIQTNTGTTVQGGSITGTGTLTKTGVGTLTLTNAATHMGGTIISAGTLAIGNGGTVGSIAGTITNNAALSFNRQDTLIYGDTIGEVITGTGSFTQAGTGTTILTSENTFTGATTISAGVLQLGNGGTQGSVGTSPITMGINGTLRFNRSDDLTHNTIVAGDGVLNQAGSNILTLTGENTYTGGTIISSGTLQIGAGSITGSVSDIGTITNNSALIFNRSNDVEYGGVIAGTGSITKLQNNTLTLTGTNTNTGITTISAGTLQIGNNGITGSFVGDIINNSSLVFNRSNDSVYGGTISGVGNITKLGTGHLTLAGASTFTGSMLLQEGVISTSADNNLGAGTLIINGGTLLTTADIESTRNISLAGGTATFDTTMGTTYTSNGQINGSGQLIKQGGGTLVLNSTLNNFSGGTLVTDGTLQVTADSLPGDIDVSGGSFLRFLQTSDGIYTGEISGAGSVIKDGNGMLTLGAIGVYTGQTNINQGILQATTDSISSTPQITINSGAALMINQNNNGAYGGFLDGNGSLIKMGSGRVMLNNANPTNPNAYTGGTFINAGTISISQDNNLGAAVGTLTLNGGGLETTATFDMNRLTSLGASGGTISPDSGTTLTYNGQIVGVGSLTKNGAGTLILTNTDNSYTGSTIVNDGVLQAGATGAFVTNGSYVVNNGTLALDSFNLSTANLVGNGGTVNVGTAVLTLNSSTDTIFASNLTGSSSANFIKNNISSLTLIADNSSYAGTATVNGGDLIVNGALGGTVLVNNGGRLKGTGTVGNTTIYGTVAPGNSIGTLKVNGNYVQAPGSTYEVELNADGQSDLIYVTGTADLLGGTVHVSNEGNLNSFQYTILTADGGISGTYSNVDYALTPFYDLALAYDFNNVYLHVNRNAVTIPSIAETPNQIAVSDAINGMGPNTPLYDSILNLPDAAAIRDALNSLSGEIYASILEGLVVNSQQLKDAMLNRLNDNIHSVSNGTSSDTEDDIDKKRTSKKHYFWTQGYGNWGRLDGNYNASTLSRNSHGIFFGVDANVMESLRVGLITGFGNADYNVNAYLSKTTSKDGYIGLYARTQYQQFTLRAGVAWAGHTLNSQRNVVYQGVNDLQRARYSAGTTQVVGELGYVLLDTNHYLEPIGQLNYLSVDSNSFAEQGNSMTALNGIKSSNNVFYTTLGVRGLSLLLQNDKWLYRVNGLLGWQYTPSALTSSTTMAFAGSSAFAISGAPIAENSLVINAGIDITPLQNKHINLQLSYTGQVSSNLQSHGVQGKLAYRL